MRRFLFVLLLALASPIARGAGETILAGASTFSGATIVGAAIANASGLLVYGGDGSAGPGAWTGKIVLFDRGNIGFAAKALAAQQGGAVGFLVANNVAGGFAGQLLPAGTTSPLPGLAISQADGATLRAAEGSTVAIHNPAAPPPAVSPFPDPTGHAGGVIATDGTRIFWARILPMGSPGSSTAKTGEAILFAANSDGTAPLSFQWAKDGTSIAGATGSTFAIAAAALSDSGAYTCTATNAAGSATSGPYLLTVGN